MRFDGKVVLVTGGATGIGRATVLKLAGEGAAIVVADVNEADGRTLVLAVNSAGGRAHFVPCDVRDEEAVGKVLAAVREQFGALHVLINAAGILQGAFQGVAELEKETFERVMDVNLLGTFLFCKHAAPLLEASGGGVILCVASGGGVKGPSSSLAYGASKAAIHGFCMTLEQQMRPLGIRVNVVCPGSLDTQMKRQNIRDGAVARGEDPDAALAAVKLGDPDGVARVLTFLASDEAEYVTGAIFTR